MSSTAVSSRSSSPAEGSTDTRTKLEKFDLNSPKVEEESIVEAIMAVLQPTLEEADQNTLHQMIRNIFPNYTRRKEPELTKAMRVLVTAIEDQLRQDNLQASQAFVDKVRLVTDNLQML